jgi:general secretion pathway protein K
MKSIRQEKGMVLLLVLVVVALLASLLTEFAFSTLVDLRLTETFRDSARAYYLAKGGIRVGRMILQEDKNDYDAPDELWGQGVSTYPVGEGQVSIRIEDLGGKLDINRLVTPQGNIDALFKDRFLRLFGMTEADDPTGLTDALIDWLDPDSDPEDYGAEDEYYQGLESSYSCKNAPLDCLDELGMVRGFTPEVIRIVTPHVTVHGSEKVNVNTASAEVLCSLAEEMDMYAAETIIDYRATVPFKKVEDLKELPGMDTLYWAINTHLAVTSPTYRIRAWAGINEGARTVEATVEKSGNKLLYLKVN